jgi:hypothetical protein
MPAPFVRPSSGLVCRIGMAVTFFPPAFWYSSSASNAVPARSSCGDVSFTLSCTRWRNVCTVCRDSCSSRARRWVDSPLAMPRSSSTSVEGACCVLANAVPVSRV